MGEIKSALEIALERTRDVQSDPQALRRHEARTEGKKMLAALREDREFDLHKALKAVPRERRTWVREGLYEAARGNLSLPQSELDLDRLDELGVVFLELARDRGGVKQLMTQLREFFSQYLSNRQQLIEELRRRYEPRLKQRQQQLSQQYGREVRIDPASDPEFSQVLQENLGQLQGQFRTALEEVDNHLRNLMDL
ncbi:MAG: hypothetical protein EA427_06715 [Spirochaetaceae bacterium]|nr:MAG: hypothetical protein EA427_06715 [Spirochaetaceae bacterium]